MQNANKIIEKLKNVFNLSTDVELAGLLKISPTTLSTWKSRNSVDYKLIITLCEENDIDLNQLLLGKKIGQSHESEPFNKLLDIVTDEVEKRIVVKLEEIRITNELIFDLLDKEHLKRKIEKAKTKSDTKKEP
ncbi:helix-turn-helix domain-containing protein [Ascidiimonas aurantiaca]|uniref:helix-turn-helix domain-containing protein n=1 Tax=Ascidiimonas aurantiaca TaxID=1685432 RepID=UPI0030ED8FD5